LLDIISAFKDFSWFKIIVTCRPDDWKIFTNIIQNNPQLESLWYDVNFDGKMTNAINIPLLNDNEIKYYLKEKEPAATFEYLKFHYPEITEIINNPYFLHLFGLSQNQENIHSDIELLSEFVYSKVLTEPYLEQKSKIINSFFHLSKNCHISTSIEKKDLPGMPYFSLAYKELISNNVLYEFTVQGNYLSVNTYVKFTSDILLGFFLANKWMEENRFDLDLIRRIYKFYEFNSQLQISILKYLIKFAFKENKADILKNVFAVIGGDNEIPFETEIKQINPEIINVLGIELRKNKDMRELLLPHFAKLKLGQLYYFESFFDMDSLVLYSGDSIDCYLENKHTLDALIYGHFIKFMQYFLAGDNLKCKREYDFFQKITLDDAIKPANAGYYFGAQLMYQSIFQGKVEPDLMERIYKKSEFLYTIDHLPFLKSKI
jgi:hypothetical protein